MIDKKGTGFLAKILRVGFIFVIVFFLLVLINMFTGASVKSFFKDFGSRSNTISLNLTEKNFTSYSKIIGDDRVIFLDYVFGAVPNHLIERTGGIEGRGKYSAVIIMIGIWLLFFLIFADIANLFSTFNKTIPWLLSFVLTVMAANLKMINYIVTIMISFSLNFAKYSIIIALVVAFLMFVLASLGIEWIRTIIEERRKSKERLRAAIKGAKVSAGIEAAERLGEVAVEE